MDRIIVPDLRLQARVGVGEQERETPQELVIEVELGLELRRAGETDDLKATVDYEAVCALVERVVQARAFRLIEAVAEQVAAELLDGFPVAQARVRVRKPRALAARGVSHAAVEVSRTRDA